MPFALVTVGLLLVITGFQNTYKAFFSQVISDNTGPQSFAYWLLSLIIVGSVGYVKDLEGLSRAMMTLIIIALVLEVYKNNPNFLGNVNSGLTTGNTASTDPIGAPLAGSAAASGGSGSSGGSDGSSVLSDIGTVASIASFF